MSIQPYRSWPECHPKGRLKWGHSPWRTLIEQSNLGLLRWAAALRVNRCDDSR
jgi:hypothetical protein